MENTGSERAKRGERAVDENHGAEDSMVCPRVAALAEAGDGSVYADRLGGGWWAIRSKGDPGSGMYRWILDEMPGTQLHRAAVFGGLGKATVDLFGADLTAARTLMAKYLGVELEDMMDRWPLAHRPTRLCRAARRARGEI